MRLKLIGAGFGRTGTMSMKHALEQLGCGPCYQLEDVIANPSRFSTWEQASQSQKPDWASIFDGYQSTVAGRRRPSGRNQPPAILRPK